MSVLSTRRMLLREFTADDVDRLVELDSDPEVTFFINGGRPTSRSYVEEEFLPHWLAYYRRGTGYGMWAAEDKATGEFLGWFHLRPGSDDPPDVPELGYRLRRAAWGSGLATEGSRALVDKAFRDLGASAVRAETMTVNTRSRSVMEKSGLRFVRTFFADWPDSIPGDELGDVEYAITREEWLRGQGAEGRGT